LASFKSTFSHYDGGIDMELAEQVNVKVDSKGRICIPAEIREEIGDTATIKRTPEGFLLLPGKKEDPVEELRKVIKSKHRRTGKPEHWTPEQMKAIWRSSDQ
jgi:bifunctional DNA-binding transcriptional regulator/antitoxin component of YhaV-PrlF toxin-antitoxin module